MTTDEGRAKRRERMHKRFKAAGYQQGRHGTCLICKQNWDDCPHSRADIDTAAAILKADEVRKRFGI